MKANVTRMLLLIFLLLVTLDCDLYAVSLSREVVEKLRKEGKLEEWMRRAKLAREKGVWQPNPVPPVRLGKLGALQGDTLPPIVICVDFEDNEHTYDAAKFDTLLFSKDFTFPSGSMRDYYLENSYGKLEVVGGVTGWYRMPENYSYYTNGQSGLGQTYPNNAQKLAEDAVNAADPDIDFADYDHDGNGWVDALIIVHAGPGAEETGSPDDIWSHKWSMSQVLTKDEVHLSVYNMDPEMHSNGTLTDMGVFGHELGHTLGLPDLYDIDETSEGLGDWSMMATGSWNNAGASPAHFDAWCKYKLGWIEVETLTVNLTNVEIPQAGTSPKAYRLWTSGALGSEYFLAENRQRVGFDSYLPGDGLLIYHVDESRPNNAGEWCPGEPPLPHYKVSLEQADGGFELEGCFGTSNQGNAGDPFPGWFDQRDFDDTTAPGSRNYSGGQTQVAIWNISDSDSSMYANMDVVWSRPNLSLDEFVLDDTTYGNGNGLPEPGERLRLYFTISNIWMPLLGTMVTGSVQNPGIVFSDSQSWVGDILSGASVSSFSDPMEFEVSQSFVSAVVTFTLRVEGNGGTYSFDLTAQRRIGWPDILIVDDDSGTGKYNNYNSYYTDALDSLQLVYNVWDKTNEGDTVYDFSDHRILIWYTGDHRQDIFSQADIESLMSFLDTGGKLFLTSQDAAEALSESGDPLDSVFLEDYLHCSLREDSVSQLLVMGVPGDTVGDGFYMYLSGLGSPKNQVSRDALVPDDAASAVVNYANAGWDFVDSLVAGIRYKGDYKLVFFGFGFEGLNISEEFGGQFLSRPHFVMQRVLDWLQEYADVPDFEEEPASIPKSIELSQNYPNPFNPATRIEFTVRGGSSRLHTRLKIYNIRGQLVRTLVDEDKAGGSYTVFWDGRDEYGKSVSSGIYFYRLAAGSSWEVRKMVLLK